MMNSPILLRKSHPFAVFKTTHNERECIMKCYLEKDIKSNEYQVLEHFQKASSKPHLYPKPYECDNTTRILNIEGSDHVVYKTLYYEFIPGTTGTDVTIEFNLTKAKEELFDHLKDLHSMGFVHGDIKRDNILRRSDGKFFLIDYGTCFNLSGDYPNNTGYKLYVENDLEDLEVAHHMMLVDKWGLMDWR